MKSRTKQKAELMKIAEEQIDRLLEWSEEAEAPNMGAVEEKVLQLRKVLSEKMTEAVVNNQAAVHPVPGPLCEHCGREMHYKGMKTKEISSWAGEVKLKRGYFYCNDCKGGLFPPGPTVRGA